MKGPEENARDICSAIGPRIRLKRKEKMLSLEELALKTGFTKSYLSQIENLKKEPPISTLAKIAYVLGVDVFFLLSGEIRQEDEQLVTIVKPSERRTVPRPFGSFGYIYESINHKKIGRLMDGYIITVGFEFPPEPLTHEGQELAYVLEGKQELFYNGKTYILEEGDTVCLDSNKPHYSRSVGDKPAKILVVFATKK